MSILPQDSCSVLTAAMDEESAAATEGKEVVNGNHAVPPGVAVEVLDGGKKKLSKECPEDLEKLLLKKEALGK